LDIQGGLAEKEEVLKDRSYFGIRKESKKMRNVLK
jgi:hypothetical protein